jgi:hypothetical protein
MYSAMGERFINYSIRQADRMEVAKKALQNRKGGSMTKIRKELRGATTEFLNHFMKNLSSKHFEMSEDVENKMLNIADFATLARSPVFINPRTQAIEYVPPAEMPPRMLAQMIQIANVLFLLDEKDEEKINSEIIYNIALDSVPGTRRLALKALLKYPGGSTAKIATSLQYPTESVRPWLLELMAHGICDRVSTRKDDLWELRPQYAKLLLSLESKDALDSILDVTDAEVEAYARMQDTPPVNDLEDDAKKYADELQIQDGPTPPRNKNDWDEIFDDDEEDDKEYNKWD